MGVAEALKGKVDRQEAQSLECKEGYFVLEKLSIYFKAKPLVSEETGSVNKLCSFALPCTRICEAPALVVQRSTTKWMSGKPTRKSDGKHMRPFCSCTF